ncbi:MAG TPA: replicative DNA helicase, partial [Ktedonobacterales bacterium]
ARRAGETTSHGKLGGYNPHMGRTLPRGRLSGYAEVLNDKHLRMLASPDLYWDKIIAIEPLGEQQVYDLTVPDGENFVAQDVLVHNTALALSLAHNAALRYGHTVGFFSLEMSKDQLAARLLSMDASVDQQRLRLGMLNDDEWDRIGETVGRLSEANIYIDDTPGIRITEMRSKARRLLMEHGCDLLIVDYLQLMQGAHSRGGSENRQQEISDISRGLKGLARELNIPVMALSQLSRAVENRTDKRPQLSDLRESGCLAGESMVFLPDLGISKRIDSLIGQTGFNVLALNEETWKLERRPVTNAFATGRKPVYRLMTRLGRSIRATGNHKFLTIDGWKRLDELSAGMRMATPRALPSPTMATMTDAELALLGHLIGDGCTLPRHTVQYTSNDQDLAELVCALAREVFGDAVSPRIQREGEARGGSWYQAYLVASGRLTHGKRNPIAAWLDELGVWGKRAHEKHVPEQVFRQPAESIASFLRHLWVTDGTAHWAGEGHAPTVQYATSSQQLANDVQTLLLRLDITARTHRVSQGDKGREQFHVAVSGQADQMRFADLVGAVGERKQAMLARVIDYHAKRAANTNRDMLPLAAWQTVVEPARVAAGVTTRQMQAGINLTYCGSTLYKSAMSRERAARVAEVVHSEKLSLLATSDVYWDEIVSIEPDGEAEVFDLTVEGHHNFVAENICLHNSLEQDADIVMFIYRDEYYNAESEKKNIADIIIAKHRNGPVGDVSLYFQKAQTRFRDLDLRTPEPY